MAYVEMNFGGSGGGTDVSDTTAIESDVAEGKVFHLADGSSAIGTLEHIESSVAGFAIPRMTSDTTPKGKARSTELNGTDTYAYKAFNYSVTNSASNIWAGKGSGSGQKLWYEFEEPYKMNAFILVQGYSVRVSKINVIARNSEDENWTVIQTHSSTNVVGFVSEITNPNYYKHWGIEILTTSSNPCIDLLQFGGINKVS